MDISEEEFQDEFSTFGVNFESEDVFDRLREQCILYKLDAGEIAMEWVAYSHSHNNCKLNPEQLDLFERERLSKKKSKGASSVINAKKIVSGTIHTIDTISSVAMETEASDDILDVYSKTPNAKPKPLNKRLHTTPENVVNKRLTGINGSPAIPFSPGSLTSPAGATPSKKYSSRTNAGEVLCEAGIPNKLWKSCRAENVTIQPYNKDNSVAENYKYMFQKLVDKSAILNDIIDEMGAKLQKHHGIEEEFTHVSLPSQDQVTVVGRVCCDGQGKLNAKSVLLEGSRTTSGGKTITVDLSELKQYALFPGQVVAMDGINSCGNKLVANKLYEPVLLDGSSDKTELSDGPISVIIACGPFTTSDNLMYEPLADLIKLLLREPPDVCILLGPFLDIKHPEVEKGNLGVTYDEHFRRTIEQLTNATSKLETQLIFVPSYRDIHHRPIYPQPPYNSKSDGRVHFVSDPSTLNIEGVVFGITSTDVLLQLGSEEISFPPGSSDRLSRLVSHILGQHNYYPLYPSSDDMNIDYEYYEHYAALPVHPHVLLTPSDLRYFIKDINGCCCINPGRLAKSQVAGTYVKLRIMPAAGEYQNKPVNQRISAQAVRI